MPRWWRQMWETLSPSPIGDESRRDKDEMIERQRQLLMRLGSYEAEVLVAQNRWPANGEPRHEP